MANSTAITEKISEGVQSLPYEKQVEVYDFVEYLKNKRRRQGGDEKSSLTDLIGIVEGPEDLAKNHDEIYD